VRLWLGACEGGRASNERERAAYDRRLLLLLRRCLLESSNVTTSRGRARNYPSPLPRFDPVPIGIFLLLSLSQCLCDSWRRSEEPPSITTITIGSSTTTTGLSLVFTSTALPSKPCPSHSQSNVVIDDSLTHKQYSSSLTRMYMSCRRRLSLTSTQVDATLSSSQHWT